MPTVEQDRTVESGTARLFDAMAGSYEVLEPWYEHLYARLHALLRAQLAPSPGRRPGRALDAGCGSGFQAGLLGELGYQSHGVDLSARLLVIARQRLREPAIVLGTLEALPYADEVFDVVSCCGSTLSFVGRPDRALAEIGRVLRPGGRLLLECEHKWSLDLLWALVSGLTRDSLGYGVTLGSAWRQIARPLGQGFWLRYPVPGPSASVLAMELRLFTRAEVRALLAGAGLVVRRTWGLHMLTNLIPSTVLHAERLVPWVERGYRALCRVDAALETVVAAQWMANSLVVLAEKPGGPRMVSS